MKKDIIPITKDILEFGVDILLDDGLIKDIPIINTIHAIYNICNTISDKLLFNKIEKFLSELDTIPTKKRMGLFKKLEKEPKLKQKTSIYILELFDKIDDENKSKMVFRVFKAYSDNKIDYEMFYRLNKVIKEIPSIDVCKVKNSDIDKQDESTKLIFLSIGLYGFWSHMDGTTYHTTKIYKIFLELKLDECYE